MTLQRVMGKLQTVCVAMNITLILITIIALPVGTYMNSSPNNGAYIFGDVENLTTWPGGWAFMLAWLSPIWTIGGFDSCVHMSEEAANAAKAVPYGILMSIGVAWGLGFIIMIVLAACISPELGDVLGTSFGQPMAQIYYDALGKQATLGEHFLFPFNNSSTNNDRSHVPPDDRTIFHGPLHPRRSLPSILGLL